tara:strand:- start:30 stop:1130 length:1101 start_codon:yes stop_codon:yes gene_type:complete
MSSRKDRFNRKDTFYMSLALNLARQRKGLTGSNPSVGCVIVKNDKVISYGQTGITGYPHAEYNAIKNCKYNLKNSSLYVTLEPCSHYGKTPPCTNLIINSKIKKVYFSVNDTDIRSSDKAKKILNKKKIVVKRFLLKKHALSFYKNYFYSKKKQLPYVVGKIACSKDKYIDVKNKIITNEQSRKVSHLLRYTNQGILISSKTLNLDNSKLTCRISGIEKNSPSRIILDKYLKTNKKSYIVNSAKNINTYFFYNKGNKQIIKYFKKKGVRLIKFELDKNNQFNLKSILNKINDLGIKNLLVEGGKNITLSFLKHGLFNEFYLFKSDSKLGKKGRINISNIAKKLTSIFKFKKNIHTYLDKDELIYYY